jgi:hypothetical protein
LRYLWLTTLLISLVLPISSAQVDPAKLAARDFHQGILIACDPYQDAERAKKSLGKDNPLKAGILPIEVYVHNTTAWPVAITLHSIRLEVGIPGQGHQDLQPLGPGDVATAILHPKQRNLEAPRPRLPVPIPGMGGGGKKWQKLHDKLEEASFQTGIVAPGSTVHGFFYFDLAKQYNLLKYARFYVPDLKFLGHEQAIMFFEVNLAPTATP